MDKRLCNECSKYMTRGYVIENGMEYYCSEECLNKHYSEEEYLELYDDGNGDSYWTTWDDEIEVEKIFLENKIIENDYFGFIKEFNNREFGDKVKFDEVLDRTLNYCLYDGYFNPYLNEKYLDYSWTCNEKTGLIYNMDDIFDVYYEILNDIENDMESELNENE